MDGEENESFGEVEQQLRPGSATKDLADIWKEIGEIKQKVAEIREIQAKLFEEYVVVDSSQDLPTKAEDDTQMENSNKDVEEVEPLLSSIFAGNVMRKSRNVQPEMSSTLQRRPRHFYSPYRHSGPKVPEDTGKDRTPSQPSLTGQHEKWRR